MTGGHESQPPRVARWLIEWMAPAGLSRDGLLGDLDELWRDRQAESGRFVADLWYWREAIGAASGHAWERLTRRGDVAASRGRSRGAEVMGSALRDVRFALRTLRRSPGFTATAILILALGIGGATAIFTVVDGVLLRPPPFAEPGRLVNVWTTYPHWRGQESLDAFWSRIPISYPEYEEWSAEAGQFEATAVYTMMPVTLTGGGAPERLMAGVASASLLEVLGVGTARGRWFLPGEDTNGDRLVVLSDGFWRRRFGGDPSAIGSTVVLNDETLTVIGVLPPGFALRNVFVTDDDGAHDVWLPVGLGSDLTQRGNRSYDVIGRLAGGATVASALAEAEPLLRGEAPPDRRGVRMELREEVEVGALRTPLYLLMAASCLLLLIACGNVATMLLGESLGRRTEMATRSALGAGRGRIVRQLVTESAILGLAGSAAGSLLALALTKMALAFGPALPIARDIGFNYRVLLFACTLGIATGVVFGMAPVLTLRMTSLRDSLGRGFAGSRKGEYGFQHGVVMLEIALTVMLLVGGGLLVRTLLNLTAVDPGFRTENIAAVEVSPSTSRLTTERAEQVYANAVRTAEALPGIESASAVAALPLLATPGSNSLDIEGYEPRTPGDPKPEARRQVILPGYHEVMGIPLLAGRLLDETDRADAPLAMVVSEHLARVFWPDGSALGGRVRYDGRWWNVVGVVGDVRHGDLAEQPVATFYVPLAQSPVRSVTLVARTAVDARSIAPSLRAAVMGVDPDVLVTGTHTMSGLLSDATADQRHRAVVVLLFALTATILAVVGVFGVTARGVARRGPELRIRLALGARASALTGMIVGRNAVVGAGGLLLGLIGALWATRLLAGFLFGVQPSDPVTWIAVTTLLFVAVVTASWLAARRIGRHDPAAVLRAQ